MIRTRSLTAAPLSVILLSLHPEEAGATYGPINEVAWHYENSDGATHPVGKKNPNAFGLYDMLGNAAERVGCKYEWEAFKDFRPVRTIKK